MTKKNSNTHKIQQTVYIQNHNFLSKTMNKKQYHHENKYTSTQSHISTLQESFTSPPTKEYTISELLHTLLQLLSSTEKKLKKVTTLHNPNKTSQKSNNNIIASAPNNTSHEKSNLHNNFILANSSSPSSSHYIPKHIATHSSTATLKQSEHTWYIAVAPAHLRGLDAIGKIFGKSRGTVRAWYQKGAPIVYDGISYCSEYNTLFTWYLNHHKSYETKTNP